MTMAAAALVVVSGRTPGRVAAGNNLELPPVAPRLPETSPVPDVWLVEQTTDYETYSNGLRVETAGSVANESRIPRSHRAGGYLYHSGTTQPVGIIYHTTESHIAPFAPDETQRLTQLGRRILDYVRQERSYHYLIDRFGRAHRVVEEHHAANHAGASIWADGLTIYMNLNHSFLGVSLESETVPGDRAPDTVTPAQVNSVSLLTAMLRSRYKIASQNCVTHAQISVNPVNLRIGNHTDWSSSFPFAAIGLPDNYALPLGAYHVFGYTYDHDYVEATGSRLWKGLSASEEHVRLQASARGLTVAQYRSELRLRYREVVNAMQVPGLYARSKEKQQ